MKYVRACITFGCFFAFLLRLRWEHWYHSCARYAQYETGASRLGFDTRKKTAKAGCLQLSKHVYQHLWFRVFVFCSNCKKPRLCRMLVALLHRYTVCAWPDEITSWIHVVTCKASIASTRVHNTKGHSLTEETEAGHTVCEIRVRPSGCDRVSRLTLSYKSVLYTEGPCQWPDWWRWQSEQVTLEVEVWLCEILVRENRQTVS